MRILKYPLEVVDEQSLLIPKDSKVVLLAVQNGILCLWLEIDENKPKHSHKLHLFGTDHNIELEHYNHIGSVGMPPFIWHLYFGDCNERSTVL